MVHRTDQSELAAFSHEDAAAAARIIRAIARRIRESRHNQDSDLIAWPLPKSRRGTSSRVAANGSDRRDRGSHL